MPHGNVEDVRCGPEITRFNELKVGDTVTFLCHAAVAVKNWEIDQHLGSITRDLERTRCDLSRWPRSTSRARRTENESNDVTPLNLSLHPLEALGRVSLTCTDDIVAFKDRPRPLPPSSRFRWNASSLSSFFPIGGSKKS
jgi:hypothetical protein